MKNKNKFILCLVIIFCFANRLSATQFVQLSLDTVVTHSTKIFEGTVISVTSFMASDSNIYTATTVRTSKILKTDGTLTCGTVQIITLGGDMTVSEGGSLSRIGTYVPGGLVFAVGQTGIFMCKNSGLPSHSPPAENPTALAVYAGPQGFILFENIGSTTLSHWYWYDLPNLDSLYHYFNVLTGYTYSSCSDSKRGFHKTDTAVTDAINYSFAHVKVTGGPTDTLQFDIMVSCNEKNTFLDWGYVGISYNTGAFGNNVAINNKIFVDMAGTFNNGAYTIGAFDNGSNKVDLVCQYSGVSSHKTIELGKPQLFCHVSMIVTTPCPYSSNLVIHYEGSEKYSDNNSNPPVGTLSDYSHGSIDNYDISLCINPSISSFSPTTVVGGIAQLLTIHGQNFGSTQGNKKVYFTNADGPNNTINAYADSFHIQSWGDSEITVLVPSRCPADTVGGVGVAGTGYIAVGTKTYKVASHTQLTISYSLGNYRYYQSTSHPAPYEFTYLRALNGSHGITFMENNHDFGLSSGTSWEMRQCIKQALSDWVCHTGVNMKIDSLFTSARHLPHDGINSISYDTSGTIVPDGTQAYTFLNYVECNDASGHPKLWTTDADIVISQKYTYYINADRASGSGTCPTNQLDFRTILEHEFGHAIGLLHTLNFDMMYPVIHGGDMKSLSSDDLGGGDYEEIAGDSTLSGVSCTNFPLLHVSCSVSGIDVTSLHSNKFFVSPNPFADAIHINMEISGNSHASGNLIVTNMQGKILYTDLNFSPAETPSLNLSFLPFGVYILKFISQGNCYYQKISKL